MSRRGGGRERDRDGRDYDFKRHRSGFDREPSPKRSKRDGKPETERQPSNPNLDVRVLTDQDQKHRRRLQDALPLEASSAPDSKADPGAVSKVSDKKSNRHHEGRKHLSDPTEVPRSQSYFEHDDRGNAWQVGRSFGWRAGTEPRWRDSKNDRDERATNKTAAHDSRRRDEKPQTRWEGDRVWRHDGFFKMEAELVPPVRKRPAFTEKKILVVSESVEKANNELARPNRSDHPTSVSERREERDRNPHHVDRSWRPVGGDWREAERDGARPPRERYIGPNGTGNYRGRERFNGKQGYLPSRTRGEKWKHDLFDEANKSPATKNEEDQIAEVEALLAS